MTKVHIVFLFCKNTIVKDNSTNFGSLRNSSTKMNWTLVLELELEFVPLPFNFRKNE